MSCLESLPILSSGQPTTVPNRLVLAQPVNRGLWWVISAIYETALTIISALESWGLRGKTFSAFCVLQIQLEWTLATSVVRMLCPQGSTTGRRYRLGEKAKWELPSTLGKCLQRRPWEPFFFCFLAWKRVTYFTTYSWQEVLPQTRSQTDPGYQSHLKLWTKNKPVRLFQMFVIEMEGCLTTTT